jgi:hypothetical protein
MWVHTIIRNLQLVLLPRQHDILDFNSFLQCLFCSEVRCGCCQLLEEFVWKNNCGYKGDVLRRAVLDLSYCTVWAMNKFVLYDWTAALGRLYGGAM